MIQKRVYHRWKVWGRDGETSETWFWCLHCGRCYKLRECKRVKTANGFLEVCAYHPNCDGNTVMDAICWDRISGTEKVPVRGVVYDAW